LSVGLVQFKHDPKIQIGKIRVTINFICSVYGGFPVGETALQLYGFTYNGEPADQKMLPIYWGHAIGGNNREGYHHQHEFLSFF
jgi:hypothetical protein